MNFTRRELLRGITMIAGAAIASSAGVGCAPSGLVDGRLVLTQWYHQYGEAGTHEAVLRYAQAYTKINPKIAINVTWVPGDYLTKLSTALLTPEGPDIFEGDLTAAMATAGQVAPLDDLFSPSDRANFTPADLDMNTVNGKLYAVKELDDVGLLYYRKSLLKQAGISRPPASMAEVADSAKRLTSNGRKGLFLGNDGGITALVSMLPWSAGCDFLAGDKIVFDNARTAASYDALRDLNNSGSLLIGAPNDYWDPSAFVQELSAMQWTGLWAYPAIKKAFGDDVDAVPWPAFDSDAASKPVTFLAGWSAMVNGQNRHVREAKEYVKWLWVNKNEAIQRDWCLSYGFHVPPHLDIARAAEPLRAPVPAVGVHAAAAYARYLPPLWNQAMTTAVTDALSNIVKLGSPAPDEIAIAARKCRRELERALE